VPQGGIRHSWTLSTHEARALQERLRERVVERDQLGEVATVGGVDVSYDRGSPVLFAAAVVLDVRTLEPIESVAVQGKALFPYVPGYLSFRTRDDSVWPVTSVSGWTSRQSAARRAS
jgi:deoxyribonuclease V